MVSDYYTDKYRVPKQHFRNIGVGPYAFCMGFNERLKEARLAAGLTGEKLGEAIGCSKQNISHWEAGRFEPNLTFLGKLCQVLDVPADWLLLGKVPEELSAGALRQAKFYDALSPDARRRWETMRMLIVSAASDETVEARMPVTKAPAHSKTPVKPSDYQRATPLPETMNTKKHKKEE